MWSTSTLSSPRNRLTNEPPSGHLNLMVATSFAPISGSVGSCPSSCFFFSYIIVNYWKTGNISMYNNYWKVKWKLQIYLIILYHKDFAHWSLLPCVPYIGNHLWKNTFVICRLSQCLWENVCKLYKLLNHLNYLKRQENVCKYTKIHKICKHFFCEWFLIYGYTKIASGQYTLLKQSQQTHLFLHGLL